MKAEGEREKKYWLKLLLQISTPLMVLLETAVLEVLVEHEADANHSSGGGGKGGEQGDAHEHGGAADLSAVGVGLGAEGGVEDELDPAGADEVDGVG